ncbi:ZNF3 protein, partial [Pteruthius melanotis]|nr:ZNF3 protein [Pteruthius melanotis]
KPCKCCDCRKSLSRNSELIIHQHLHTGEKPYKCFSWSSSLTHQHLQTWKWPYNCGKCGESFRRGSCLIHRQMIH